MIKRKEKNPPQQNYKYSPQSMPVINGFNPSQSMNLSQSANIGYTQHSQQHINLAQSTNLG